ncbi:hypothetical protein BDW22DRAFT_186968 [Trametopsis cervina]|nr:hypothetical protein BDW22DRAFT_186968 [Trametopsis cervina]
MATPSLDHDPSNASSPLYNSENVAGSSSDGHSGGQHGSQSAAHKYSNGPHIRSRITVVCAECKRLKLKCDRRTPCSSCLKRDTVQRCLYSQAAAEKIDVQSLHNRLLVVEGHLAQLTSSSSSSVPPFKSSYPGSTPPQPYPTSSSQANTSTFALRPHSSTSLGVCPSNEHALLVTGGSGSSVVISLDDAVGLWMNEVETPLAVDDSLKPSGGRSNTTGAGGVRVKLEPTPVSIPPSSTPMPGHLRNTAGCTSAFVPPLPYSIFLPASDSRIPTPQSHLDPISPLRGDLPQSLSELMLIHPCFNVQHFEKRVEAMLAWGETNRGAENAAKRDLAREVFFGGAGGGQAKRSAGKERGSHSKASSPKPTLSFFSASCAAFALGALMTRDHPSDNPGSSSSSSPSPEEEAMRVRRSDPTALFALSEQCLHFFEKTHAYDVDSVIAMLLQILYMLHDGQMQVGQTVLPLVGKVVNVARMMGLGIDPDEFAGTYSLFEAETRRRVWWDVFYYDMLVSECMGQQPLIPESSFTTKIPADVDEDKFNPSTTTIPTLPTEDGEAVPTYLGLNRLL